MRFVLLPEGILPPVPVFLSNCSVYISLVNLPISSQLPFTTISTVSESTLSVELHTQLQMKSFLKREIWSSLLYACFSPGQNLWAMALMLGAGTMVNFFLNDTLDLVVENLVERGSSSTSTWLAFPFVKHSTPWAGERWSGPQYSEALHPMSGVWVKGSPHFLFILTWNLVSETGSRGQEKICSHPVPPRMIILQIRVGGKGVLCSWLLQPEWSFHITELEWGGTE